MRPPLRHALVALLLAACGGESGSTERASAPLEPTVRDSAGVTIYEHAADALERAPIITYDSVPMTVIGGVELENDVTRLVGLAVMADGRVAGFDGEIGAVKLFSPTGDLLGAWGTRGEGPNEFRAVDQLIVLEGDSLAAADWVAGRVTVLHPDTGIVRQEAVPLRGNRQIFTVTGRLASGEWVVAPGGVIFAGRTAGAEPDTTRPAIPVGAYRGGSGADHFDTLVVHYGARYERFQQQMRGNTELMEGPPRFSGLPMGTAWGGHAVAIPNDRWQVERYDATGSLHSIIRADVPRVPLSDQLLDSMTAVTVADYRERLATSERRDQMPSVEEVEYNARNAAYADSVPHFTRVHPTGGRTLWLRGWSITSRDSVRYTVVDPEGRIVGQLTMPPATWVMAFADDRIILRQEDEDGIITFAVHRLRMP